MDDTRRELLRSWLTKAASDLRFCAQPAPTGGEAVKTETLNPAELLAAALGPPGMARFLVYSSQATATTPANAVNGCVTNPFNHSTCVN